MFCRSNKHDYFSDRRSTLILKCFQRKLLVKNWLIRCIRYLPIIEINELLSVWYLKKKKSLFSSEMPSILRRRTSIRINYYLEWFSFKSSGKV